MYDNVLMLIHHFNILYIMKTEHLDITFVLFCSIVK